MKTIHTAMIMAAGYGKRMGDLTENTPKPLLRIGDATLLDIQLSKLERAGIRRVVINLHYQAEKIIDHLKHRPPQNIEVLFSPEPEILGTGGGIARAASYFGDEAILVINSDILSDLSLTDFLTYFGKTNNFSALTVWPSKDYENYSLVEYNPGNKLIDFHRKNSIPKTSNNIGIFMGYYILSNSARQYLKPHYSSVIEDFFRKALQKNKPIDVYTHSGMWIDVGTNENYQRLRESYQKGEFEMESMLR
jgi:NDP-sugar pyrophosphorylase family protein